MKIGDKVILVGTHPWKDHTGVFIEMRNTPKGPRPLIQLDDAKQKVFVMKASDCKVIL